MTEERSVSKAEMYPVSIVVCERLESLEDWLGSSFLSNITKSSESPMSSKLIELKSLLQSSLLLSASDKLFD